MIGRPSLAAAAIVLALGIATPNEVASAKPLDFLKELIDKSPFKAKRPARPPTPKKEVATVPDDAVIPIPRPRPHRDGEPRPARDFDAAFVPPPVLTIPAGAQPAAIEGAATPEPEAIPLGPPRASSRSAADFPFPVPRPRPADLPVEPLAMLPADPLPGPPKRLAVPEMAGCVASLAALGVEAKPLAPVAEGTCGIAVPAAVASLEDGAVKLPIKALVNCRMAETAARWLKDSVQPAATASLGGRVTGLQIAASYDCRTRDHIAGAKMSEHAFGNAIDLSAFRVNGRWIEVGGEHDASEQAFFSRIRGAACGPFKTVLGPGTDSYHADHLHLDLAQRRTAGPSKGLYCK